MAKTLLQLSTSLAYRLGEDSPPGDANELNRRYSYINEAYRDVMRQHYWWFSEATSTFNSVASQDSYTYGTGGVPSDIRLILELRFQDKVYKQITQTQGMSALSVPYTNAAMSYFLFNSKIYPIPPFSSAVTNGVSIKYFKSPTELTTTSSTIIIPDIFSDCLVAYAYGRVMQGESERGSADDGFKEYAEIIKLMTEEQNKYLFSLKGAVGNTEITAAYS